MQQVGRSKLSESIARMIVENIRNGTYPPGAKMPPEREIMKMLGVGRSSVREAFQSLAIMGVLDIGAGQGTYVRDISSDTVISPYLLAPLVDPRSAAEFLEARLVVEPSIAALAAERHTEEEYRAMSGILDQCEEAISRKEPVNSLGGDFHMRIAQSTHNMVFVRFIEAVVGMLVARGEKIKADRKFLDQELKSHREVLASIGSRNPERARRAMDEHIRMVSQYHMKYNAAAG
jgi:GntR family transcriptional repressor for pyruvate dehydrogenase complex